MKKVVLSAFVLFALAMSVSSCKSKEDCAAYQSKISKKEAKANY